MRSQRRFENNAVWCERSEAALFDTGVRKGAFYVGGLLLPREVFWKRILAKSRSLRRFGCQCERVHRIMRRERPNNALGDDVLLLYLAPFFKPHSPKCGNPTLGVKANRSVAAAKRMNWKWSSVRSDCAFGDMKGVLVNIISLIPRLSHRLSYVSFRTTCISWSWNSSPTISWLPVRYASIYIIHMYPMCVAQSATRGIL